MYFIANWKMFGDLNSLKSIDKIISFFRGFKKKKYLKIVYCPPNTLISSMTQKLKSVNIPKNKKKLYYNLEIINIALLNNK